jgi:hypothetical protein
LKLNLERLKLLDEQIETLDATLGAGVEEV